MRMRIAWMVSVSLLVPAVAQASKPSVADAKKAAKAWIDAMGLSRDSTDPAEPAAIALTATPFYSVAYEETAEEPLCAETTATDAPGLAKALACLRGHVDDDGNLRAWSRKDRKDLVGRFLANEKKLEKVAKDATLVVLDMPCAGAYNTVVFAVAKDKDGAAKIAGVLSSHGDCGE